MRIRNRISGARRISVAWSVTHPVTATVRRNGTTTARNKGAAVISVLGCVNAHRCIISITPKYTTLALVTRLHREMQTSLSSLEVTAQGLLCP